MRAERPEKYMGVGGEGGLEKEDIFDTKIRGSGVEGHFRPEIVVKCTGTERPERPRETMRSLGTLASVNILSSLPGQSCRGEALASRGSGGKQKGVESRASWYIGIC